MRPILSQKSGRQTIAVSVVLGTLVGMVLSMLSIKLIPVAHCLHPVQPDAGDDPAHLRLFPQRTGQPREILGALITVGGVSLLFI